MAYAQPTYPNHPGSVGPPGTMYTMGGMPGGQQTLQYRMLTGPSSATAGHGGPLGSGPGVPVGVGRGGAMPMTVNGQPQGPGAGMPMRYGQPQMGVGRAMPNGMVQTNLGRGIGMPGAVGGVPGMRMVYPPGMNPPPGTRIMTAPGSMPGHPGQQYLVNVNQHGQAVSFAQMPQSQQQHANPNGPGGPGQSSAHMLIPLPQPGGPPQQPPPLGGPGMTHPGGPGQKLYQQQQTFMGGMTPGQMGALPPLSGGSPVRNPSPNAATPANAPTPGGPGTGRGMTKPPTPANAQPFASTNAPTPGGRPGTASGPQNPASYTPRMTTAEMAGAGASVQSSPGSMQRNHSTNMGLQQQQQLQAQQTPLSQPGGPPPQSIGPSGPGGPMDHSSLFRPTPAQMEIERNMQIYGPSQTQGPMEGVRYAMMGPTPGQVAQEQQRQRQMMNPPQPVPLQPQHTGGSISSQSGQLAPQHTGGARPLAPQHTGGSMQDSAMNGPGSAATVPRGRTSVPSTPQMASRQASMSMGGGPPGMMPMGTTPGMPAIPGYPIGPGMAPPPPRNEGFRSLPMELGEVSAATMGSGGMMGIGSRHAFGVLRLLQFSSQMKHLSGYDAEKWSSIIADNFTENATLSFRAQKETRQPTTTFGMLVKLPFPLLVRFFATLTQSGINRMSLILDGAIESQDGQEYTVYCGTARWPMYYGSGYVLELNGVLKARCKTVPVTLPGSETGNPAGAPSSTPRMSSAALANPNTNGLSSSPSSSSNMHASPTNKPSTTGNVSNGSETKPFIPTQNVPYMVKIDELSFDSGSVNKLIDFGSMTSNQLPREPDNVFGVPKLTMRMIEFCEGTQALAPLIDYESTQNMGALPALNALATHYEQVKGRGQALPPREPPDEPYPYAHLPGQGMGWMKAKDALAAVTEALHSGMLMKGPISFDDPSTSGSPSTLSANVNQRMSDPIEPSSNSTSEPTVSPLLAPKTPGKKNAAPGSPTKATTNGITDKDKGGGKRKNTNEVEGPPTKRRTRGKGSKVN